MPEPSTTGPGNFTALWQRFRGLVWSGRAFIVVAGVSLVVGLGLAASYATVADYVSSLNYCAHSCHEMDATVYKEYTQTAHFRNAHGVVAVCADCHVPRNNWLAELETHIAASTELWGHVVGGESDLTKFNARRPALEKMVWADFAATKARECKACHVWANMVLSEQNTAASAMHAMAMKSDENCLDCHKGVAHTVVSEPSTAAVVAVATTPSPSAQTQPSAGQLAAGEAVYGKHCAACHAAMAPKLGDKAAWAPLLKQGEQALVDATIKGKGVMPARGGDATLSDDDIRASVVYMESKVL